MTISLESHVAALGLVALDVVVRAARVRLLLGADRQLSLGRAIAINALGDAASAITPARLGGEPARFVAFRRATMGASRIIAALAAEKLIDWTMIIGIAVVLLLGLADTAAGGLGRLINAAQSPTAIVLLGVVIALSVVSLLAVRHYRNGGGVTPSLRETWAAVARLGTRPSDPPFRRSAVILALATVLTTISMAARIAVLPVLLAGSVEVNLGAVILASFGLLYSQIVLPTPAGAGAVELGFIAALSGSMNVADAAMVLATWRGYTLILGVLPAAAIFFVPTPGSSCGAVSRFPFRVSRCRSRVSRFTFLVCITLAATTELTAQRAGPPTRRPGDQSASHLLATDHWSYEYIRRLRDRGYLAGLNPLVQPYRRVEVARGLADLERDTLGEPVAGWVRLLRDEFERELDLLDRDKAVRWGEVMVAGTRASTSRRLDALRPLGDAGVWPWYNLGAWVETGPLTAEVRLLGDNYVADAPDGTGDPDGLDPGQRRGGRSDHAYVSLQYPWGAFTLGRLKRNWAPLGTAGLMVSDVPTSYPQIAFEASAGRLSLRAFTGELDTIMGQKRYLAAHRIDYGTEYLFLSFGESILYAAERGASLLRYLNPVEFLFFDADNEPSDVTINLMLDIQFWYRHGEVVVHGEGMLDDIDVDPKGQDRAPTRYGFRIGSRWLPRSIPLTFGLEYEQISSFAYRTSGTVDHYSYLQRGVGANFTDYDRFTLSADVFAPVQGLTITPTVQVQRQGEGDLRVPFGSYDQFRASPALFLGVKETTYRLGLRGRYQPNRLLWVAWDVGENFVRNARHVGGDNVTNFSGVAEVGLMIELPLRRRQ